MQPESELAREERPVAANVAIGVGVGVLVATGLSAFVLLGYAARGGAPNQYGIPTGQIVAFYYAAGAVGGAVGGLLAPIGRWYLGRVAISYVLMNVVYGLCAVTVGGVARSEWRSFFAFMQIILVPVAFVAPRLAGWSGRAA